MTITGLLFGCWHENVTFPQRGWQKCTDCGARRRYRIGCEPGAWITGPELRNAEAKEAAEKNLATA